MPAYKSLYPGLNGLLWSKNPKNTGMECLSIMSLFVNTDLYKTSWPRHMSCCSISRSVLFVFRIVTLTLGFLS